MLEDDDEKIPYQIGEVFVSMTQVMLGNDETSQLNYTKLSHKTGKLNWVTKLVLSVLNWTMWTNWSILNWSIRT